MKRIILVFILLLSPVSSFAGEVGYPLIPGEYVLVKGEGMEVCEEYGKNLNSFKLYSKYDMACERKINPEFTEFKTPEWRKMDLWKNRKFLKKVERFLGLQQRRYGRDPHKNPKEWERLLKERISETDFPTTIMTSQIDINNDGKKENIIRYNDGACPIGNFFGAPLIVLNDDKSEVDIEKTKPFFQNPQFTIPIEPFSSAWQSTMYDVFFYKGKAYFDRWGIGLMTGSDAAEILKVFVTETDKNGNFSTEEICRYRFKSVK